MEAELLYPELRYGLCSVQFSNQLRHQLIEATLVQRLDLPLFKIYISE